MTNPAHTLMLIPARGGSKRLPGKCLRTIGGVTLLGRTISAARRAARLLASPVRIVVSTDDDAIAAEARRCGAEIPFMRPADIAGDDAPTASAVRHALAHFSQCGVSFDAVVLLQPTSPLRSADDIVRTVRTFRSDPTQPVVTVCEGHAATHSVNFGALRDRLVASGEGDAVMLNGAVYAFGPEWLRERDTVAVAGHTRTVRMPADRSVDIDTADDFARAERFWGASSPWPQDRCYVIAEAGVNHDGNLNDARRLIEAAANAGADAVKFQTFDPDQLATRDAPKAEYQSRAQTQGNTQRDMLAALALSPDDHRELQAHAAECGIVFLSSGFDVADIDLLDALDVPMLKIGSGEITHHALLAHAARTLRPIILSTGAAELCEVESAVDVLRSNGCDHLALLHCVSAYPAACTDLNLRAITTLAKTFNVPVGFSDHTLGIEAACAAVALGACIVEKHLTLDRKRTGPDHRASFEPHEFAALTQAIRNVYAALGNGSKSPRPVESDVRSAARRSVVAACDLPAGTLLTAAHLAAKRPAGGICPTMQHLLIGRRLVRDVTRDAAIAWSDMAELGETLCAR